MAIEQLRKEGIGKDKDKDKGIGVIIFTKLNLKGGENGKSSGAKDPPGLIGRIWMYNTFAANLKQHKGMVLDKIWEHIQNLDYAVLKEIGKVI